MTFLNPLNNVHDFSPETSIPDLKDRVIVVTGGNAGIGKQIVLELSRHNPQRVYLATRSRAKFDVAMEDILKGNSGANAHVEYLELDLASLTSVKTAAKKILDREERLDILIGNGGIMAKPPALSPDGYEIQFATNYLGHAALTKLLIPLMQKTAQSLPENLKHPVRVVHVSSSAAYSGLVPSKVRWTDQSSKREDINEYARYGISKLAQVHYARESAKAWPEVVHTAVHPGRVDTTMLDEFLNSGKKWSLMGVIQRTFDTVAGQMTTEQGALTPLWAATWAGEVKNGGLYTPVGVHRDGNAQCRDEKLGRELWNWTEGELKKFGI